MISESQDIIRNELETGTGATIDIAVDERGTRTALRIWFKDLEENQGPVAELRPYGLHGYRVNLRFGSFSRPILRQIKDAGEDEVRLARALVASINSAVELNLSGQTLENWYVASGAFKITATARGLPNDNDEALIHVCREVLVPLMAAMAELIGYEVIDEESKKTKELEGAILESTIRRRERNPRNRLLCIRIHGEKCACCGMVPCIDYRQAGDIIEVHHLEALSSLSAPKAYNPATDLVPLCPNCHRAVHTRRPAPWSIEDLKTIISSSDDVDAAT